MDAATRRNLELDTSLAGREDATLAGVIDRTATAMGARELRRWIRRPLRDRDALRARYGAIAALIKADRYDGLHEILRGIGDVERVLARVALRSARPRDLAALREGLGALPRLQAALGGLDAPLLAAAARGPRAAPGAARPAPARARRDAAAAPARGRRHRRRLRRRARRTALDRDRRRQSPARARGARAAPHRDHPAQGRVQPRPRLLHRAAAQPVGARAARLRSAARRSRTPSATSRRSSSSSRTRCSAAATARWRASASCSTGCSTA